MWDLGSEIFTPMYVGRRVTIGRERENQKLGSCFSICIEVVVIEVQ